MITMISSAGHNDGDDEAEEADSFSEDEDQDHSYEQLGLDCVHSNTNITDYTDGETRRLDEYFNKIDCYAYKSGETAAHAGDQMLVSLGIVVVLIDYMA